MIAAQLQRHLGRAHVARVLERILHRHAPKVVALVVVQRAAIHGHRAALAIDNVGRLHARSIERRGIGRQLEGRARLVDIAHRQVLQHARVHVLLVVRVEARRDRQRQDLPRVRILHHNRAVGRLHLGHLRVERLLRHVLDVGVDAQHQVLTRLRLVHLAAQRVTLGVHRRQHMPGSSVHVFVELQLQSAKPGVVRAHIAQHMRGQLVVRVKALELLLEVHALQVQLANPVRRRSIHAARHPRKAMRRVEARQHLVLGGKVVGRVFMHHTRKNRRRAAAILAQLTRYGVDRVHLHRNRKLLQVAVVEHAAPRCDLKRRGLLLGRAGDPLAMLHHLQPHQPARNGQRPHAEEQRHKGKPLPFNGSGQLLSGRLYWLHRSLFFGCHPAGVCACSRFSLTSPG